MSVTPELEQIAVLAEIDDLVAGLHRWADDCPDWSTARKARALVRRVGDRVQSLRIRLESPLVVATFGGTGTGKSTLVNAMVGQDVTAAGRQRPTTRTPILLIHSTVDPAALGLDPEQFQIRKVDAPLLKDIVVIDCPDPDTSESATAGSNLAMLRSLLPHCDVLIYTSTQQKYRSARVFDELADSASGCRLVFVQTHADVDSDIREDWKNCLSADWQVPEMFFVDSQRAMREQLQGQRPSGDFGRLIELLSNQLGASRRVAIRRANLADLLEETLTICKSDYEQALPRVDALSAALEQQRDQMRETLSGQLLEELLQNRNLWERRLLGTVADMWGFSPFSAVLRLYNGLGSFIASFSFFRARSSAQMALIGAVQGARWIRAQAQEQEAGVNLDRLASFGISDQQLQEARMVVSGFVRSAGIENVGHGENPRTVGGRAADPRSDGRVNAAAISIVGARDLTALRQQAASVESEFLKDARRGVDRLIDELAQRHCGWLTRAWYECLFLLYLLFLVGRIGHNFFWSSFLAPLIRQGQAREALLTIDFYVPAIIFLVIWSGLLVLSITWKLRRGLTSRIAALAESLVAGKLAYGLFPTLEQTCRDIRTDHQLLTALLERTSHFRRRLAVPGNFLGGRRVD